MSMVDITAKPEIYREATARGRIKLRPETVRLIKEGSVEKGDPIYAAKIAGILAAKNTPALIPLCHPIPITNVDINVKIVDESTLEVEATVKSRAQTGVEMEALVAASMALLTIWDMVKKYEKDFEGQYPYTSIQDIRVVKKVKDK
ncbi:MAG: cyclic pyranopterin monophosphate synthase MoaC [Candidatus Bathyarchaeia archaeon]